ncbi:MAG: hypothetical protein MJE68_29790 [Proteobacteria bacterium]|nr:hypothetical protein [Pseudomonadota bacterium]
MGIKIERVRGLRIDCCPFVDGSNGSSEVAIDLDENTTDVRIGQGNAFSNVAKKLNLESGFTRSRLCVEPEFRPVADNGVVLDYNGDLFSTAPNATIDMSEKLSQFPSECPPKGYIVNIQARDSGCETGTAFVRLKEAIGESDQTGVLLALSGQKNNTTYGAEGFIPCDENGDICIRTVATGTGTLQVWLRVTAIIM